MTTIRVIGSAGDPRMLAYMPDMTAGSALSRAGVALDRSLQITVNGRRAREDSPLKPGAIVAQQPLAYNG